MESLSGPGPTRYRPWLLSAFTLLLLSGCATTQLAEEGQPLRTEALDMGYGKIGEGHLAGPASTVYSEEGQIIRPRRMIDLVARLPGVQIRESSMGNVSLLVRGARPLYVLDGVIFRGSINSIDPNSVESISVLKNAGETAIYGSQVGHGGVILIRTKKGRGK